MHLGDAIFGERKSMVEQEFKHDFQRTALKSTGSPPDRSGLERWMFPEKGLHLHIFHLEQVAPGVDIPAWKCLLISACPGLGWDRVNFPKKPGGDTARGWSKLAKQMGYSIPCAIMLGAEEGSWQGEGELGSGAAGHRHWAVRELPCVFPCFVYSSYQYCCCYCSLPPFC